MRTKFEKPGTFATPHLLGRTIRLVEGVTILYIVFPPHLKYWQGFTGLRAVHSPRRNEVLLLDEPDFGVDLNGDLDATDFSVRRLELVDRTHTQQKLELELKTGKTKSFGFEFKLQRRRRHHSSHEAFDIAHVNRTDDRDSARASLAFGEDTGLRAKVGVTYTRQKTDRAGDPASTGEISDYRRLGGFFRLTFTF